MTFKSKAEILSADPRFQAMAVVGAEGTRPLLVTDHWEVISEVTLGKTVPSAIAASFDRARNTLLYAYFAYEMIVVAEGLAFAAFEMALRHRLPPIRKATLRILVDKARKLGLLPPVQSVSAFDPIDAIVELRNALAHGGEDIHTPAMALDMLEACAFWINHLFSDGQARSPHPS